MYRPIAPIALILALCLLAAPLPAKDEEPTANEVAIDFAKAFKKTYKKRPATDVLTDIDKLVGFYLDKSVDGKKARKAILDALARAAMDRDSEIRAKVMKQAGKMDEGIVKLVISVLMIELKKKVPEDSVYESALESLGKLHSANPAATKTLTKLLKNDDDTIVARAARALGGYAGQPGRIRVQLFEEVLKASEGVYSQAQAQNDRQKRKWNIIRDDALEALNKLSTPPSTEKFKNPQRARSWFNDHKKKSWDKGS